MRLRYKKEILIILISTMGIGIVTLAASPHQNAKESMTYNNTKDITGSVVTSTTPSPIITLTPTLTPTPTPTPMPIYDLEEDGYPEIVTLIDAYYKAKLACDIKELKTLLSDPSDVGTKKELQENVQYIEEYNNIKCYVKRSFEDGTYIVYVYNEVKFININTPAPAVYQFFIITDEAGKVKIFSGELDDVTNEYYSARKDDTDVQKLIEETNTKAAKAKKSDKSLKSFWNNLIKAQGSSNASEN